MKFTLVKDLRGNTLLRPLLGGLLFFILLFLSADIVLKNDHIGLSVTALSATLYGDEAQYLEPVTFHFILELLHSDIFFMMMTLLTLSAIYARLCAKHRLRLIMINITMLGALFDIVLLMCAYFLGSIYIPLWLASFWLWHAGALFMAIVSLWNLFVSKRHLL